MILLGMDTCGSVGSLALARVRSGDAPELQLLGSAELAGRTTAAMLVPTLRELLATASIKLGEVEALVVVDGPGSFTGIRIGLAAAKALAAALELRVFSVSRLRVLADAHSADGAVLHAGRGEFYMGCYATGGDPVGHPSICEEGLFTREELSIRLAAEGFSGAACSRLVACEEKVANALSAVRLVAQPTALQAIESALSEVEADRPRDILSLDGRYLRRAGLYRAAETYPAGSL